MKQLVRNALVIVAFVVTLLGAFLFLRPYVARWIFLLRNSPFTVVSRTLSNDPVPSVRGQAALTLVSIDRVKAVRPLVHALQTDPVIRRDVENALILVGKPALLPLLDLAVDKIASQAPDKELLKSVVVVFRGIGEPAVSSLFKLLREEVTSQDPDQELLEIIVNALARTETKEGKDDWLRLVKDRTMSSEIRLDALRLLGRADATAIEQVANYLDTPQMRLEAVQAIRESDNVNLVQFLTENFLADSDSDVRRATLAAMGYLLREEKEEASTESPGIITPTNLLEPSQTPIISPTFTIPPTSTQ